MLDSAAEKSIQLDDDKQRTPETSSLITRKIWLPKAVYDALPWFYMTAGIVAFLATMYISEWFWVVPHYLLFSAACVHLAVVILRRRDDGPDNDPD